MSFEPEKFVAWINAKHQESYHGNPRLRSISAFSRGLDIPSQVVSNWILGKVKEAPSTRYSAKLIAKFGVEAYTPLGMVPPPVDPGLEALPPDLRDRYRAALLEIGTTLAKRSIDPESPEAVEISTAILSKHRLIVIDN